MISNGSGNSSFGLRNSSVANFKVLIGLPCMFLSLLLFDVSLE